MGTNPLAWVRTLGGLSLYVLRSMGRMGLFLARALVSLVTTPLKVRLVLERRRRQD